eukprot:GFUD01019838.1.p1 GENE.GFUD01019838.1~~GFUD01019838.1.p1  ORF type:complete len:638 (-),score=130.04 GFUD01019838.1:175-2088(-)
MPLQNLQLLLRPTPGGLPKHRHFISSQADHSLRSELFFDLILQTPDGEASCHQSLLVPLSPLLSSLLSSTPSYPGLVHTVVTPLSLHTVKSILKVVYTGKVSLMCRLDMDLVLAGLQVLGIHIPGLECYQGGGECYQAAEDMVTTTVRRPGLASTSQAQDFSTPRLSRAEYTNNNSLVLPFPTPLVPHSNTSLSNSIVQLPSVIPDTKTIIPFPSSGNIPSPPLSFIELQTQLASQLLPLVIDESVQCNVVGCRSQVSLQILADHFKAHQNGFEAFKCNVCNMGFKHKKALEIHRIREHQFIENPLYMNEATRIDESVLAEMKIEPNLPVTSKDKENNDSEVGIRKKILRIIQVDNDVMGNVKDINDHPQLTAKDLQSHLVCVLCRASLPTEWYRHPRRHRCPHATPTPKKVLPVSNQSHCQMCDTTVASSWHKPASRHVCPVGSGIINTPGTDLPFCTDKSQASTSGTKKRTISASSQPLRKKQCLSTLVPEWDQNFSKTTSTINKPMQLDSCTSRSIRNIESPEVHSCPLTNCIRKCSSKKDLLIHLAMSHYLKELEEEFATGSGTRNCLECDQVLPNNKLGFIKHMAVKHEIVMTFVKRDLTQEVALDQALESVCRIALPGEDEVQPGDNDDGN